MVIETVALCRGATLLVLGCLTGVGLLQSPALPPALSPDHLPSESLSSPPITTAMFITILFLFVWLVGFGPYPTVLRLTLPRDSSGGTQGTLLGARNQTKVGLVQGQRPPLCAVALALWRVDLNVGGVYSIPGTSKSPRITNGDHQ